jgi:hypothetical protein
MMKEATSIVMVPLGTMDGGRRYGGNDLSRVGAHEALSAGRPM